MRGGGEFTIGLDRSRYSTAQPRTLRIRDYTHRHGDVKPSRLAAAAFDLPSPGLSGTNVRLASGPARWPAPRQRCNYSSPLPARCVNALWSDGFCRATVRRRLSRVDLLKPPHRHADRHLATEVSRRPQPASQLGQPLAAGVMLLV